MIGRCTVSSLIVAVGLINTVVAAVPAKRANYVLIGYRYVNKDKATDYMSQDTLTGVGASGTQIGDGAYISPTLAEWSVPKNYYACAVFADEGKFNTAPKYYIPRGQPGFDYDPAGLTQSLKKAKLTEKWTLLWSQIKNDPAPPHIQLKIPTEYLTKSKKFSGAHGRDYLMIKVQCVPKEEEKKIWFGNANWGATWTIPGFGCDLVQTTGGSASCPLPSSEGKNQAPFFTSAAKSLSPEASSQPTRSVSSVNEKATAFEPGVSLLPSGSSASLPAVVTSGMIHSSHSITSAALPTGSNLSSSGRSASRSHSANSGSASATGSKAGAASKNSSSKTAASTSKSTASNTTKKSNGTGTPKARRE